MCSVTCVVDGLGEQLCERVLTVLFELWVLACSRHFPSPPLWKTFHMMCANWRHHVALVVQWHRLNTVFTARLLQLMYGPAYPRLYVGEWQLAHVWPPPTRGSMSVSDSWLTISPTYPRLYVGEWQLAHVRPRLPAALCRWVTAGSCMAPPTRGSMSASNIWLTYSPTYPWLYVGEWQLAHVWPRLPVALCRWVTAGSRIAPPTRGSMSVSDSWLLYDSYVHWRRTTVIPHSPLNQGLKTKYFTFSYFLLYSYSKIYPVKIFL